MGGNNELQPDDVAPPKDQRAPVKWYRSTFYNMTILGLANLSAPGIWAAMNSLGAGGAASPELINAANALTFCLMVLSCYFSSVFVKYFTIKGALIFGTLGYAPYAAGLYTNNRFGNEWLILVGATFCGICAGVFWMAESAIAIAYPEPWNKGKALGYWLTYRVGGQIIGGAISLGLNAENSEKGQVTHTVFLIFIAIQACGPFVAAFLTPPDKVEREDGRKVALAIDDNPWYEIKKMTMNFFTPKFLLVLFWIGQAVFAEAVMFTYLAVWFSVRARALGSFLSGIVAITGGNILGFWLDRNSISFKTRVRSAFWFIVVIQGAWWSWGTALVTRFRIEQPIYDWATPGFGPAFALYVCLNFGFQLNFLFLYTIITNLADDEKEVIRYSALLRGVESAFQAVSYGLTSTTLFSEVGAIYMNFGLWGISIIPAWMVLRHFGTRKEEVSGESSGSSGVMSSDAGSDSEKGAGRKEGSDAMPSVSHVG